MRTEEKKREALKLKEVKITPPDTPVDTVADEPSIAAEAPLSVEVLGDKPQDNLTAVEDRKTANSPSTDVFEGTSEYQNDAHESQEAQQDIPQQSIEVCSFWFKS